MDWHTASAAINDTGSNIFCHVFDCSSSSSYSDTERHSSPNLSIHTDWSYNAIAHPGKKLCSPSMIFD
jgi:hypothetical protein